MDCVVAARSLVKPGGYLLLDDSDRPEYLEADHMLPGWGLRRVVGVRQFPLAATETTIYKRPGPAEARAQEGTDELPRALST